MRINYFSCRNFRNLEETEINNFDEMNVICGENAQGKTNLLEGMWLFTGIKSFRSAKDAAFVRFGKEKAELKMDFSADGIENDAEIEIKEHRTAALNGMPGTIICADKLPNKTVSVDEKVRRRWRAALRQ